VDLDRKVTEDWTDSLGCLVEMDSKETEDLMEERGLEVYLAFLGYA
jgi:hypothetical protein